jgi:hypothetical protein
MPSDEQGNENLVQHFVLADDDLANLLEDAVTQEVKAFHALLQISRIQFSRG